MSKYPGRIVTDLAPAGYSVFFDGTGDYLTGPTNTATAFNLTGNFTIECWAYFNSVSTSFAGLVSWSDSSGWNGWQFQNNAGTLTFEFLTGSAGAGTTTSSAGALTTGRWFHLAAVRSGSTITLYINGVSSGTPVTYSSSQTSSSSFIKVAADRLATALTTGYISNVRVVNGTALYTAAFTPPTQLFNITNTSLLTCNSPAIIDQSNNAFAITVNGNSAVSTLTPFTAYVPYNPALGASTPGVWTLDEALQAKGTRQWNMYDPSFNLTTLLLHGNGTNAAQNNTFLDSSSNNFSITRNPASGPNAPTQGSFSPFSQTGWSNYFDGTGDYLTWPSGSSVAFGTGDFTVECWVYPLAAGNTIQGGFYFVDARNASQTSAWAFTTNVDDSVGNAYRMDWFNGSTSTFSTGYLRQNAWNHCVYTRSGTSGAMFLNGTRVASFTDSNNYSVSPTISYIGSRFSNNYQLNGYMSNLRIVKGTAVYNPSNLSITVPTVPLGATSGGQTPPTGTQTSLLTCQSNRFVDNGTANSGSGFALTVNGTPSVQAFSPFYSTAAYTPQTIGGSGYFDGVGDFLTVASNAAFGYGTGNVTIEAWVYHTSRSTTGTIYASDTDNLNIFIKTSGLLAYYTGSVVDTTFTVPLNSWTHVAFVRSGTGANQTKMYANGVEVLSTTNSINYATTSVRVGTNPGVAADLFTGYISNVRIVKGVAVYTGAFTPPRAPLAASGAASASAYSSTTNVDTSFAASATSLLCNFTNAGIVDATAKNVLETVGNAQISTTQSKFGGSSMAFDGTGDYLVFPANPLYAFGTGDFTVEAWVYPTSNAAVLNICGTRTSAGTVNGWNWGILTNGSSQMYSNSAIANTGASTVPLNTWTHLAFVRTGGTIYGYVNGVQRGSTANTENFTINTFWVGITGGTAEPFFGYIDDLRITRFARYTGNFTPQTSQWQDE